MMVNGQPDPNAESDIILSVLICSIPERFDTLRTITERVLNQAKDKPVEVLIFMDNKKRSIGDKRTDMMNLANGRYFILLDDDDDCSDDYVEELLKATESRADIISFDQRAIIHGLGEGIVNFSLNNENEEFKPNGITRRKPFSVCAFKTETFAGLNFGHSNYGEDMVFSEQAWKIAKSEYHIDKVLHTYTYHPNITAAL